MHKKIERRPARSEVEDDCVLLQSHRQDNVHQPIKKHIKGNINSSRKQ